MKHANERTEESVLRRTRHAVTAPAGTEPASPQGLYAAAGGPQDGATV